MDDLLGIRGFEVVKINFGLMAVENIAIANKPKLSDIIHALWQKHQKTIHHFLEA